jgi:hypothetical protein
VVGIGAIGTGQVGDCQHITFVNESSEVQGRRSEHSGSGWLSCSEGWKLVVCALGAVQAVIKSIVRVNGTTSARGCGNDPGLSSKRNGSKSWIAVVYLIRERSPLGCYYTVSFDDRVFSLQISKSKG